MKTWLVRGGPAENRLAALAALAQRERYLAAEVEGRRYDFGVKYGLLTAQLALALEGRIAKKSSADWSNRWRHRVNGSACIASP